MKKLSLMMLIALFLLVACNKENQLESFRSITLNSQLNDAGKNEFYNSVTIDGVTKFHDMLWFKDQESFLKAIETLDEFQEKDIEFFNSKYVTKTDEQLENYSWEEFEDYILEIEKKEIEIGFSDVGIYKQFEQALNFNSLRKKMFDLEYQFLNSQDENWDNYPEHEFIPFESEQTVFNIYEEVRIGNEIYKMIEEGYFIVKDGDYSTLLKLRNNISSGFTLENVSFVSNSEELTGKTESNNCLAGKHSKGEYKAPGNSNLKIKWKVGIRTLPGQNNRYVYAKSTNFYKKSKVKSYTKVAVFGQIGTTLNCTFAAVFNTPISVFKSANNVKKEKHKVRVQTATQSGWVKGYHESRIKGVTVTYESTLTWF